MLLDESRLFCCVSIKSKKLRFALIWERLGGAAGGVCKRREEEISWQRQLVVLEDGYERVDESRNARGKQPNWEIAKVSGTKRLSQQPSFCLALLLDIGTYESNMKSQ
jgi:hypothetical protein